MNASGDDSGRICAPASISSEFVPRFELNRVPPKPSAITRSTGLTL